MQFFVPALYYGLIATAALHLVSLSNSLWLGMMFRKISLMPPDMNPLEDNLTARPQHKRTTTSSTVFSSIDGEKQRPESYASSKSSSAGTRPASQPSSVPFLHTRTGSNHSGQFWATRGLPRRQYQIVPGNASQNLPNLYAHERLANLSPARSASDENLQTGTQHRAASHMEVSPSGGALKRHANAWSPTASDLSRSKWHNFGSVVDQRLARQAASSKSYNALAQHCEEENLTGFEYGDENLGSGQNFNSKMGHPNPLQLHPASLRPSHIEGTLAPTAMEPDGTLMELSANSRCSINAAETAVFRRLRNTDVPRFKDLTQWHEGKNGQENSELRLMDSAGMNRKISSGVDYDFNRSLGIHGRRNFSGAAAEEGQIP